MKEEIIKIKKSERELAETIRRIIQQEERAGKLRQRLIKLEKERLADYD